MKGLPGSSESSPAVATVNGSPISQEFFNFYVKNLTNGKNVSDLTPEQRSSVLDALIRLELVAQQASKDGLDKSTDTASMVEASRLNVLQRLVIDKEVKRPTEQEVRTEYEKALTTYPKQEYRARYIVVATADYAQKIIGRLEKGEKFDELAKQESMDPSKTNGGDIGWFTLNQLDKGLADAVGSLKNGAYTKTPVQTSYGWHVVQLMDTRDVTPPAYDRARPQIEQILENRKYKDYTDELMRTAKIDKKLDEKGAKAAADGKTSSSSSSSTGSSNASTTG
jgi:peptidyl-prolyl cis-trans isomerase C